MHPLHTTAWQVHHLKQQEIEQLHILYAILHHRIVDVPQQCEIFVLKRIRVAMGFLLHLTKGSRLFLTTCAKMCITKMYFISKT